jgi:hypothetical protein
MLLALCTAPGCAGMQRGYGAGYHGTIPVACWVEMVLGGAVLTAARSPAANCSSASLPRVHFLFPVHMHNLATYTPPAARAVAAAAPHT